VRIIGGIVIAPSALGPVKDKQTRSRLEAACVDRVLVADLEALGLEKPSSLTSRKERSNSRKK
jgi:hypothetical protein